MGDQSRKRGITAETRRDLQSARQTDNLSAVRKRGRLVSGEGEWELVSREEEGRFCQQGGRGAVLSAVKQW